MRGRRLNCDHGMGAMASARRPAKVRGLLRGGPQSIPSSLGDFIYSIPQSVFFILLTIGTPTHKHIQTIMANELIINVTLGETRVARLENGIVSEIHIERAKEQGVVGNVYKGKVVRVLPGMQAAFIEIGLDRTAFLHASDVTHETIRFFDEEESSEEDEVKRSRGKGRKIEDLLKEGAELVGQVEKEQLGTK